MAQTVSQWRKKSNSKARAKQVIREDAFFKLGSISAVTNGIPAPCCNMPPVEGLPAQPLFFVLHGLKLDEDLPN